VTASPADTWLTRTLGISVPVVQAPMARVAEGPLAAAVSAAGALGMIGVGPGATPSYVLEQAGIAGASGHPYGIGLMAWALEADQGPLDAALDTDAALVSVSFGAFEEPVRRIKASGKLATTQVGNLAEALRAEQAGVDVVVARGREAGGHGRDEVGTLPLLATVLDRLELPVLAAGGIADHRGLAAVLAGGAAGAWVGTAFLCCREASLPPAARERLLAAGDTATVYGRVFDVALRAAWPREFGGRALRNAFFDTWVGREDELAADEAALEGFAAAQRRGDFDTGVIYAGEGVALLQQEATAAAVLAAFSGEVVGERPRDRPPGTLDG
jgi:nitronate monooxygenase